MAENRALCFKWSCIRLKWPFADVGKTIHNEPYTTECITFYVAAIERTWTSPTELEVITFGWDPTLYVLGELHKGWNDLLSFLWKHMPQLHDEPYTIKCILILFCHDWKNMDDWTSPCTYRIRIENIWRRPELLCFKGSCIRVEITSCSVGSSFLWKHMPQWWKYKQYMMNRNRKNMDMSPCTCIHNYNW